MIQFGLVELLVPCSYFVFILVLRSVEKLTMTTASDEETSIRAFLKERPRNAKAMARLSSLLTERYRFPSSDSNEKERLRKEAVAWAKKSIELSPNRPAGYVSLSVASSSHKERMKSLVRAVELLESKEQTIEETSAYVGSLARLLVEPREEEAKTCNVGRASSEHPSRRDLSGTEAALYQRTMTALEMVWDSDPKSPDVVRYVGQVELRLGLFFRKMLPGDVYRPRSKRHLLKACQRLPPNDPLGKKAKFWLATFSADGDMDEGESSKFVVGIDRCPEEYVVSLYSSFATTFDSLLVEKLKYETPTKLRELVDAVMNFPDPNTVWADHAIDLGCGTGLSGDAFRDCTRHLTGVDLSPEMIEKARQRNCYNELVVGDVTNFLSCRQGHSGTQHKYDLIFSCDVFVYLGDLSKVFSTVRSALSDKDGLFAFSTEYLEENVAEEHPYILQPCARFAHKRSYIEELATSFGFEELMLQIRPIRKNKGQNVLGILGVFRNA